MEPVVKVEIERNSDGSSGYTFTVFVNGYGVRTGLADTLQDIWETLEAHPITEDTIKKFPA